MREVLMVKRGWELLIFDWDGVLLDSRRQALQVYNAVLEHFGLPKITLSYLKDNGSANWYEFYSRMGIPKDRWREADELWLSLYRRKRPKLYPDASKILRALKLSGYSLALVTNGSPSRVKAEIAKEGLEAIFEYLIFCKDREAMKPSPAMIEEALKEASVKREEAIYIGDMPEDIVAARRAGIVAVALSCGFSSKRRLEALEPDYLFPTLSHLAKELLGIDPGLIGSP